MSMLNFKHGLYANLKNAELSAGTIYVTTDEKAMYVDLPDANGVTQRIRLSQIVNVPDVTAWQNLTPPFSTEAFYYIVDANALLKYTGSAWVQINSTAELDAVVEGLGVYTVAPETPKNGDILVQNGTVKIYDEDAEGTKWIDYTTIGDAILDVTDRVAVLESTVATHGTDITNLKTRVTDLETASAETRQTVGFLGKKDAKPESAQVGDTVLVDGKVYIWLAAQGEAPAGWSEVHSLGARVEALKARIEDVAAAAGDQTAVDNLQTQLTTLSNVVNHTETGLGATKAIADKAAKDLADYVAAHADDYDNKAIDDAVAEAKKAGTDANAALESYKKTHDELYNALVVRVKALEDADYLKRDGSDAMAGELKLGGHKISGVSAPEADTDAANKIYVDTEVGKANTAAGNAAKAASDAAAAAAAADAKGAQGIADAAAALAEAQSKTTMAAVEAKNYATKSEAEGYANAKDEAIAAAKKAGDDAQETASSAAKAFSDFTNGATAKTLKELEEQISGISGNIDDLDNTFAKDSDVADAIDDVLGYNEDGTAYAGTVKGAYDAAAVVSGNLATEKDRIDDILDGGTDYKSFGDVESKLDAIDQTISQLGNTYATDDELDTAKETILGEYTDGESKKAYTGTVGSVYDKAVTNAANITTLDGKIDTLDAKVTGALQAADAMVYKGTVSAASDLPTVAQKGWTYKATTDIAKATFAEGSVIWATVSNQPKDELYVRAGDLFIATGDEGTDGNITNLKWDHVPAGYNADYVPTMASAVDSGVATVKLTSAHAAEGETGDLGSFQISAAEGSAVTIAAAAGNNIAIGMTWGTF